MIVVKLDDIDRSKRLDNRISRSAFQSSPNCPYVRRAASLVIEMELLELTPYRISLPVVVCSPGSVCSPLVDGRLAAVLSADVLLVLPKPLILFAILAVLLILFLCSRSHKPLCFIWAAIVPVQTFPSSLSISKLSERWYFSVAMLLLIGMNLGTSPFLFAFTYLTHAIQTHPTEPNATVGIVIVPHFLVLCCVVLRCCALLCFPCRVMWPVQWTKAMVIFVRILGQDGTGLGISVWECAVRILLSFSAQLNSA